MRLARQKPKVGPETTSSSYHRDVPLDLAGRAQRGHQQVTLDFRERTSIRSRKPIEADVSLLPRAFFQAYATARRRSARGAELIKKLEGEGVDGQGQGLKEGAQKFGKCTGHGMAREEPDDGC